MRTALLLVLATLLVACQPTPPAYTGGSIDALELIDLAEGEGDAARHGQQVRVHYTGWLYDEAAEQQRGAEFDSSLGRGVPFEFLLGAGRVIRGWDEGVVGMREGGRRILMLPPEYGYGERGAGNRIPPGASLVFEVELVEVVGD